MRGVVIALTALLVLLAGAVAQMSAQTPGQDRLYESLRRELTDALQATGRFSSIAATGKSSLKAKSLEGKEIAIGIDSLAADVGATPVQRKGLIAKFMRSILAEVEPEKAAATREEFIASLRLIVRARDYLSAMREQKSEPLWRSLAGSAIVMIAIDGGERLQIAVADAGKPHGLTDDDLFRHAGEQLARFLVDMEAEDAAGIRALTVSDAAYSPSLLLLDEPWTTAATDFGAGFVVAIPDRTTLLVAAARNAPQLRKAVDLVAKSRRTLPMIPELLQRSGTKWIVYAGP